MKNIWLTTKEIEMLNKYISVWLSEEKNNTKEQEKLNELIIIAGVLLKISDK